jgi:hypothetical protein
MTAKRTIVLMLSAMLLAAFATGGAAGKPGLEEDGEKIVMSNEHVRVWFQGKKPMLKVFPANENDESAYEYHFTDVVEYRDVDGDGGPADQEVVATLNLNKASAWNVTRVEEEGSVTLNLTMSAPVRLGRGVDLPQNVSLPAEDATVSLVFRIFDEETTLDAGNETVTVARTAIKYDFIVSSWPFVDADANRLALETLVGGMIELENGTGAAQVSVNGTQVGALTWIQNATGTDAEGAAIDVPVRTTVALEEDNMSRLVFTYDAPGLSTLVHDPTIGTTGESGPIESGAGGDNAVPMPAVALVAIGAGAAALATRRR